MPPHSESSAMGGPSTATRSAYRTSGASSWFGSKGDIFCSNPNMALLMPSNIDVPDKLSIPEAASCNPRPSSNATLMKNMQCSHLEGAMKIPTNMARCAPSSHRYQSSSASNAHLTFRAVGRTIGIVANKKKRKSRKRVSFVMQPHIVEIPSIRDMTQLEFSATYMTKEEMGRIHEECWRLVDLMNSGIDYEDGIGFSKRGLVDLKEDSVERRRQMRDQAYRIVFGVQKFHSNNRRLRPTTDCTLDITDITANLYHKAAARSQEEAYEAAWFDAIAARM